MNDNHETATKHLAPVIGLSRLRTRTCANCEYIKYPSDGSVVCIRPKGPAWDAGDCEEYDHVCGLWRKYKP